MKLLVGLGNPGRSYAGNRHNIGFIALDALASRLKATPWRARFQGETAEAALGPLKALLLKPATYMNESGRAVAAAMQFYKIALGDVIVFHDELDLPPATVRVKIGGGNAGHNGLRSITALCGNEYVRVRLGIGHPGDKALVHGYVLNDFGKDERAWVDDLTGAISDNIQPLLAGRDAPFASAIRAAMTARGWTDVKRLGEKADG